MKRQVIWICIISFSNSVLWWLPGELLSRVHIQAWVFKAGCATDLELDERVFINKNGISAEVLVFFLVIADIW